MRRLFFVLCLLGNRFSAGSNARIKLNDRSTRKNPFHLHIRCDVQDVGSAAQQYLTAHQRSLLTANALLELARNNEQLARAVETNKVPQELLEQLLQLWYYHNWSIMAAQMLSQELEVHAGKDRAQAAANSVLPINCRAPDGTCVTYEDGTIFINGIYYRPRIAGALAMIHTSVELAAVIRDPKALAPLLQRQRCSIM